MKGIIVKSQVEAFDSPNGNPVSSLTKGTSIKILEMESDWVKFGKKIQGKVRTAYVEKKFVEPVILWKGSVQVRTSLNVRKGAGTSHEVIASLKNEQPVLVLEELAGEAVNGETGWLEIMHKDGIAFIFAKYVKKIEDANELAASIESLDDEGWGDEDDFEVTESWDDVEVAQTPPKTDNTAAALEEKEEEAEEETGMWNKVKSWFS